MQLGDLTAWCREVAGQLESLEYDEKRMALVALGIEVEVYSVKHSPRYRITARLPLGEQIVSGTTRS